MTLQDRESALREAMAILPDVQERLTVLTQRAARRWGLEETEKLEHRLVPGCVSRVWLVAEVHEGIMKLRCDADSPLVLGLAGLLCELYDGLTPAAILSGKARILHDLGIASQLSPTRLRGWGSIEAAIHQAASPHVPN